MKMKTTVVNKYKEPFDVYIGRGSLFGNPFLIGKHGNREEVRDIVDAVEDIRRLNNKEEEGLTEEELVEMVDIKDFLAEIESDIDYWKGVFEGV